MDSIPDHAENTLKSRVSWGKRGRKSFKTHVSIHQNAHHDIQLMTGMEMLGRDEVQKLLNLITPPNMQTVMATVKALEMYHTDFNMVVNYLKSFVQDSPSDCRNMSSMQQNDNEGKVNSKGGTLEVEARFYKLSEWAKLSPDEQCKVHDL